MTENISVKQYDEIANLKLNDLLIISNIKLLISGRESVWRVQQVCWPASHSRSSDQCVLITIVSGHSPVLLYHYHNYFQQCMNDML